MSRSVEMETEPGELYDGTLVVQASGELDIATAESLYQRGHAAIARRARLLLLDMTRVSFCDSRGLSALVRIANEADVAGCRYGLIAPQPLVAKVLRITGLDRRLQSFRTVAEARMRLGSRRPVVA